MIFTVEEVNLIQAMEHENRRMLIYDIKHCLPAIEDEDLKELCRKTLKKVSAMTDANFEAIDFTVYEEERE